MKDRRVDNKVYATSKLYGLKDKSNGSEFNVESDDDSSIHDHVRVGDGGEGRERSGYVRFEDRVRISLDVMSKVKVNELRRLLLGELEVVRSLRKKLETRGVKLSEHAGVNGYSRSPMLGDKVLGKGGGTLQVNSEVGSVGHRESGQFQRHSVSAMDNGSGRHVGKEKKTPKANQQYRDLDFSHRKEKTPPRKSNKKLKSAPVGLNKNLDKVFRSCSNLLTKLMKHKFGWVFNKPVDAKALGLHDYHVIIKRPMDLGTIRNKLNKNWYKSPLEFAEDVRLTFRNAMAYNPKDQDAHILAKQMLEIFEDKWVAIEAEYNRDSDFSMGNDEVLPTPTSRNASLPPPPQMRALDRSESMATNVNSNVKPTYGAPASQNPVPNKPIAKDPPKKDMTYEEKQRLSVELQNLPPEKLDGIVEIIKRRNSALCQQDDEIELDIDTVDGETLWELDKYVSNYKKSLHKNKRKADIALQTNAEAGSSNQEMNFAPVSVGAAKETLKAEGEKISRFPAHNRQGDNVSRSSSSNSSSSDSGSSSSDSDNDSSPAS